MAETLPARTPAEAAGLLPYARHSISAEDRAEVSRVLASSQIAQGSEIEAFESALCATVCSRHAVAVSSGTSALQLALAALGVGPGDEVIVPSLTFVATANAVALCGAIPRFVDVEPGTLTLSPDAVARVRTARTRGAIPMHYAGHPADIEAIRGALRPDNFILEDACHGLGAFRGQRPVGSLGDAACFSFHPAKAITTGEGGAVVSDRSELVGLLRALREHGIERAAEKHAGLGLPAELSAEEQGAWVYEQDRLSGNHRLGDAAAVLGTSQLHRLGEFIEQRRKRAAGYRQALSDLDALELPSESPGSRSAWHLYAVQVEPSALLGGRAALFRALRERGIGVQVHYIPVHLQPYYRRRLGTSWGDLPVTEDAYLRLLSLPLFPSMTDSDVDRVVDELRTGLRRLRR